jgi:hypothetical protein
VDKGQFHLVTPHKVLRRIAVENEMRTLREKFLEKSSVVQAELKAGGNRQKKNKF